MFLECGNIFLNGIPNLIQIDAKIIVNQNISHCDVSVPGDSPWSARNSSEIFDAASPMIWMW